MDGTLNTALCMAEQTVKLTVCTDCPCKSVDYDAGPDCNLNYNQRYAWAHKTSRQEVPKDAVQQNRFAHESLLVSDNCKLKQVITEDLTFIPAKLP